MQKTNLIYRVQLTQLIHILRIMYQLQRSYRCGRNSELIINKNNILLKVIDTNFSTSQLTMVLNFFFLYIVSLFVYNVS